MTYVSRDRLGIAVNIGIIKSMGGVEEEEH